MWWRPGPRDPVPSAPVSIRLVSVRIGNLRIVRIGNVRIRIRKNVRLAYPHKCTITNVLKCHVTYAGYDGATAVIYVSVIVTSPTHQVTVRRRCAWCLIVRPLDAKIQFK